MSKLNESVAALLSRLQDRLTRVAREGRQNSDRVAALTDEVRLKVGKLQDEQAGVVVRTNERMSVAEGLLANRITQVKNENDDREQRQVLRDQNNVQSLVNLRDSTAKAFIQVKTDVEELLNQIRRVSIELKAVKDFVELNIAGSSVSIARIEDLVTRVISLEKNSGLPSDHAWVNKKLTGVYHRTAELERRLEQIEDTLKPPVTYLLYKITSRVNVLVVDGNEFFPFQSPIIGLDSRAYGVIITLADGSKHILCGGPSPNTMFINGWIDATSDEPQGGKCVA